MTTGSTASATEAPADRRPRRCPVRLATLLLRPPVQPVIRPVVAVAKSLPCC